jgi:hypothetical protein
MILLSTQPDAKEIVVERAKFVCDAAANGTYDDVLAMLTNMSARQQFNFVTSRAPLLRQ